MQPFAVIKMGGMGALDQQQTTSGVSGVLPDRKRGFSTTFAIGSSVDGTVNLDGTNRAITELYHDETTGLLHLKVTGVTNTGWTTMRIVGQVDLLRASGTFAANEWTWATANPMGGAGAARTVLWIA